MQAYSLLKVGVPDLNTTKFITRRIGPNLPTDVATVAIITGNGLSSDTIGYVRIITFLCGATARSVECLLNDISSNADHWVMSVINDQPLTGDNKVIGVQIESLRSVIMKELLQKNIKLIKELANVSSEYIDYGVAMINWEIRFQPLKYEEVKKVWRTVSDQLFLKHLITVNDRLDADSIVVHLTDQGCFTIGSIRGGHVDDIYPICVFQVLKLHLTADLATASMATMVKQVRAGLIALRQRVNDPGVEAAAQRVVAISDTKSCIVS